MATVATTPHHRQSSHHQQQHNRSLSSSSQQQQYSNSPLSPSMADTLPSVDFGFDDLKTRMAQFTARFDEFIEKGRRRVLEERNEFRGAVGELEETQSTHLKSLTHIQSLLSTHAATLQAHATEKRDLLTTINDISTRQTTVLSQRDRLKAQIAETHRAIDARLRVQEDYARKMDGLARMNQPELNFWESHLGCRIEGAGGVDRLRVVYWLVESKPKHSEKGGQGRQAMNERQEEEEEEEGEAYFDLSTESRDYKVLTTKPRLDKNKVDDVQERLNANRDFGAFLRGMRALFVEGLA